MAESPPPRRPISSIWVNAVCGGVLTGTVLLLRGQGRSWLVSMLVGLPVAFVLLLLGALLVGRLKSKS